MRKTKDEIVTCPVCELTKCKDEDECYVEHLAQREQDHKDFVADMEESKIARLMARADDYVSHMIDVVRNK